MARMKPSEACLSTEYTKSDRRRDESLQPTWQTALGVWAAVGEGSNGTARLCGRSSMPGQVYYSLVAT